ncbi:MAG: hypothetical protein ACD_30C00092G0021 [uncultured bacterium]|uniref:WD40-domain containing protein n=3 Tax=Candidatus Daviesiibacteriota TaxID=1752718 RepID=A0A0G0EX17_9BACT|nr:MAG: hypothetical protein ACD_30C00092G0021 [uncultured bacterium]KKQ10037.1 MAG: WD40-domain containing protein [Candidatus Daviesbacteria bacterium GW2011_GWB1_36_5]KKQ15924.1 MAG: WD40-domain containing protein [Candidatus Daviesbacteria bacterium GW2011_GWA1_36_8]
MEFIMKKTLVTILIFLSIIALILQFGIRPLEGLLNLKERAGLRVESTPKTKIFIDNKEVGEVPYQEENFSEGEYLISLKDEASGSATLWSGYVKLNGGTLSVVNRDIQKTQALSSGEVITLEKGAGVTIISNPSGAEVLMDGVIIGRTPLIYTEIISGEHQFLLSKDSFLKRTIRATLIDGYNLTLNADLAISEAELTKLPTPPVTALPQVLIKQTPTGFLRVRDKASLNGKEIAQVKPGESLTLLEESGEWFKVRLPDGQEGYISSQYAEKKNQ